MLYYQYQPLMFPPDMSNLTTLTPVPSFSSKHSILCPPFLFFYTGHLKLVSPPSPWFHKWSLIHHLHFYGLKEILLSSICITCVHTTVPQMLTDFLVVLLFEILQISQYQILSLCIHFLTFHRNFTSTIQN